MVLDGPVSRQLPTESDEARSLDQELLAPKPGSAEWWTQRDATDAKRRPRSGGLTTARIIEAALEILRDGGLEALTVRALAERFETSNASLYRHFASRDELIALIGDHVMGEVRLDRTGRGWRADVEALMSEMRRVILSQPLPSSAARRMSAYGPNMLRVLDAALGPFLEAGLSDDEAARTTISLINFVAGSADIDRSDAGRGPRGDTGSAGFDLLLDRLPPDRFEALRTAGNAYTAAAADEVFAHGLAIFLDGVTSQLAATGR
ncbi:MULTISPECIES: TetR/AcrR family transcriptional regulator [unclassified Frankia]|uniref:TetR/AcrR family transcriptional regulator n=1 Tax=unclassified Frankia TaxID=2632575 RepID=UPI0027DC2318|nr:MULTISPECIES: TetR/AcrR family transcriptional regulator [unclassified Frankia]